MSIQIKYKEADKWVLARLFEKSSQKNTCSCCGKNAHGIVVRHFEPEKKETLICEQCIIAITTDQQIPLDGVPDWFFGRHDQRYNYSEERRLMHVARHEQMRILRLAKGKKERDEKKAQETSESVDAVEPEDVDETPEELIDDVIDELIIDSVEDIIEIPKEKSKEEVGYRKVDNKRPLY
jgi:hypothetical protein